MAKQTYGERLSTLLGVKAFVAVLVVASLSSYALLEREARVGSSRGY